MDQTKSITKSKELLIVGQFALFLGLAIAAPFLGNQLLTGTLVNGLLAISVFSFGIGGAMLVALLPSSISLFLGLLPAVMAPMVPFIILSNIAFVLVLNSLRNKNYFLGGVLGSLAKASFLFAISYIMFNFFLSGNGARVASSMMSYMQLLTALLGITIAYPLVKFVKK